MEENKIPETQEFTEEEAEEITDFSDEESEYSKVKEAPNPLRRFLAPEYIALFISLISAIISIVSVATDKTSRNIAAKELEILTNDREAYFCAEATTDGYYTTTENGYDEYVIPYIVKNEGGRISGTSVKTSVHIKFFVNYTKAPEYENGKMISEGEYFSELYIIPMRDFSYLDAESYKVYNAQTKSFKAYYRYPKNIYDYLKSVTEKLEKIDENVSAGSARYNEIQISYCNFENVSKTVTYNLGTDYMAIVPDDWKDEYTQTDCRVVNLNYAFTDFGDTDAQNLANLIHTRFKLSKRTAYYTNAS